MPITYQVRREHHLILLVHIGTIPDDEFLAFYKSLYENDRIDPLMNLLVDLRQADSTPRSPDVLRQFAQFIQAKLKEVPEQPKVAVVAPEDLSFGLARMYEIFSYSVPWDFEVFRTMDDALAWLGLPEDFINGPEKE